MVHEHFANNIFKQACTHFSSQLNDFKYFDQIQIILFTFNHLFAQIFLVSRIAL